MSAMLHVYLDPGSPTKEFDLSGMDVYGFAMSKTTRAVTGASAIGELIFDRLDEEDRNMLRVKGHAFEEHLVLRSAKILKRALFNYYKAATFVFEHEQEQARATLEKKDTPASSFETLIFFKRLQRDVAGAVFICDLAIREGKSVYWALA